MPRRKQQVDISGRIGRLGANGRIWPAEYDTGKAIDVKTRPVPNGGICSVGAGAFVVFDSYPPEGWDREAFIEQATAFVAGQQLEEVEQEADEQPTESGTAKEAGE